MTGPAIASIVEETEVTEKARRRRFTVEYKRRIVKQADACLKQGELGALLRREGLYSSHLVTWRRARERGELITAPKRGRKPVPADPSAKRIVELERKLAKAEARAEHAEALVELQNDRARQGRSPVRRETTLVVSMASREEWPPAFWCSANP